MNKSDLTSAVIKAQEELGHSISKKEVASVVDLTFAIIAHEINEGTKVSISNFGTFKKGMRAERKGVNPNTKEPMVIRAKEAAKFKASKNLID